MKKDGQEPNEEVKTELTPEEINEQLRQDAYAEVDGIEDTKEGDEEESEEEFSFDDDEDETPADSDKEEPSKDESESDEETTEEDSIEDADHKEEPATEEVNLKELAEKYNVSEDEAESIIKQQKHYKNDPNEIAKALLNSQRGYSKVEAELKALKEQKSIPKVKDVTISDVKQHIRSNQYQINGRFFSEDDIVSEYARANPELTQDLEDDKVFELACREIRNMTNEQSKDKVKAFPAEAKARRAEFKAAMKDQVPEEHMEEFRAALDKVENVNLMNEQFNLDGLARLIKGAHYDEDVKKVEKEAYEKGLKAGKENAKIVTPPVSGGNGSSKKEGAGTISFTGEQSKRAEAMFGTTSLSTKEKRVSYIVLYPEEFTKSQVSWAQKQDKLIGGTK